MTSTGSRQRVLPRGVKLISVWFIIFGALSWAIGARAILLFAFPAVVPEMLGSGPYIANFGVSFGSSVGVDLAGEAFFWCVLGALNTAAMLGVLRLRGWARWLAMGESTHALRAFLVPDKILRLTVAEKVAESGARQHE